MPDDSPAAEVTFDEYPNVDVTPRVNGHSYPPYKQVDFTPNPEYDRKLKPRPHWFLRFYRMLRKLERKRQESEKVRALHAGLAAERKRLQKDYRETREADIREIEGKRKELAKESAAMAKRLESRDKAMDEMRQKLELRIQQLQETIASREKQIKTYAELDIPKLERELEVAQAHIEHLTKLVEKKLTYEEMQIAVLNKNIVDAETAGEMAVRQAQMMERGR